ncbi:MAG: helix-turn-helix domain-containing protein [Flavobacteriales bacterium]
MSEKPADEQGGLELAVKITGLARRTIYKLTCYRKIPHSRVGGRLYFRRSELEAWIDAGRRKTAAEVAEERMAGNK